VLWVKPCLHRWIRISPNITSADDDESCIYRAFDGDYGFRYLRSQYGNTLNTKGISAEKTTDINANLLQSSTRLPRWCLQFYQRIPDFRIYRVAVWKMQTTIW
jgi:hypothetical protein